MTKPDGLTETVAKKNTDGTYSLYGTKWFTSATTAEMALTLALAGATDKLFLLAEWALAMVVAAMSLGISIIVAAAIHGGASLIVTFNLKDFPPERLKPYNLAAQHPDDFIFDLLDLHAARVCEAAANHRRSLKNPPKTADEYLDTLLKQGLTQTVGLLREWKAAI